MDQGTVFWIIMFSGTFVLAIPFGIVNSAVKSAAKRPDGVPVRLKRIRTALGMAMALLIVSCGVGWHFSLSEPERRAVHGFVTPLVRGQHARAHARSSKRFQERTTPDDFEAYIDDRVPDLLRSTSVWALPMGGDSKMFCVALWLHGPVKNSLVYAVLAKEDDAWKLDDLSESQPLYCSWVSFEQITR